MGYTDRERQRAFAREWVAARRAAWMAGRVCASCSTTRSLRVFHPTCSTKGVWTRTAAYRERVLADAVVLCSRCAMTPGVKEATMADRPVLRVRVDVDKDALMVAMCEKLPDAGQPFTSGDQERWLDAMRAILSFLYPPEWTLEARQRGRKAPTDKEAAAAFFPTVHAPAYGKVTIGVPPDGFEPVLIVPADVRSGQVEAMRRHVEATLAEYGEGLTAEVDATPLLQEADDEMKPCVPVECPDVATQRVEGIYTVLSMDPAAVLATTIEAYRHAMTMTEEAPSTTSADAVDGESGGEEASESGAGHAPATSSPPSVRTPAPTSASTGPPESGHGSRSTVVTAPVLAELVAEAEPTLAELEAERDPPKRRHYTADQKGAILRRVVREGIRAVSDDLPIHDTILRRWMREMPLTVKAHQDEWAAERTPKPLDDASMKRAIELAAKPAVQWPTAPIERRPIDPDKVRRDQAGTA